MLCPHVLTFINSRSTLLSRNWDKTEIRIWPYLCHTNKKKGKKQQRTDNGNVSDWNMIIKTKQLIKKKSLFVPRPRGKRSIHLKYIRSEMSDDPFSLLLLWGQQSGVFPSERRSVCLSSPALHPAPTASRHLREGARTSVGGWKCVRACGASLPLCKWKETGFQCTGKRARCSIQHGIRFEWQHTQHMCVFVCDWKFGSSLCITAAQEWIPFDPGLHQEPVRTVALVMLFAASVRRETSLRPGATRRCRPELPSLLVFYSTVTIDRKYHIIF